MRLPEHISPTLFLTHNGRLTTEAQTTLAAAQQLAENGRNVYDLAELRKAVGVIALYVHSHGNPRQMVFPLVGIMAGSLDRKIWRGAPLAGAFVRFSHYFLERSCESKDGRCGPGWNDYFMAAWFFTGDPEHLAELFARATLTRTDPESELIHHGALWLLNVGRLRYFDLDAGVRDLETRYGGPLPTMSAEGMAGAPPLS